MQYLEAAQVELHNRQRFNGHAPNKDDMDGRKRKQPTNVPGTMYHVSGKLCTNTVPGTNSSTFF